MRPSTTPSDPISDFSDFEVEDGRRKARPKRTPPAKLFRDGELESELLYHKDFEGPVPLCFVDTGLNEGGPHDYYVCFDKNDLLWGRRVKYLMNRLRTKKRQLAAREARVPMVFAR